MGYKNDSMIIVPRDNRDKVQEDWSMVGSLTQSCGVQLGKRRLLL